MDLARWNGRSSRRWNEFVTDLRRCLALGLEYFRAVEVQQRGALHLHVLVRVRSGAARLTVGQLRELAIHHGFGHSVDLQEVTDSGRAAGYVAKYVSKASGERGEVPFVHPTTGEVAPGRWRTWTASREWGETMAGVRAAQQAWAQQQPAPDGEHRAAGTAALDPSLLSYAEGTITPPSDRVPAPV